jgi:hypothetical protein
MSRRMRKFPLILAICCILVSCSSSKNSKSQDRENAVVREPSPIEPQNPPKATISGLKADELLSAPRSVQITVDGYPMEEGWQGFEVVLNDQEPTRFFSSPVNFQIPLEKLRKGANLIKVYLVRSWGESLKIPEAFAFVPFFYETKGGLSWVAAKRPIVTLVSPRGIYKGEAAKKILFDFMVQNPEKLPKSYKVHYTLNGKKLELDSGKSYYFYNLVPADYELRVEVVNARGIPLGQEVTRSRSTFKVVE